MSKSGDEEWLKYDERAQKDAKEMGFLYSGRKAHLNTCSSNTTEETRQLNLKPSKDYRLLPKSKKEVHQTELDCTEFDKATIKVIVRGKLILVQGTKKNQPDETTLTYDIPDQCDLERIEAGFRSNDVLYIRFPSKNEPAVKV